MGFEDRPSISLDIELILSCYVHIGLNMAHTSYPIPFWTPHTHNISSHLWLPSSDSIHILDPNHYDESLKRLATNSWFTINAYINIEARESHPVYHLRYTRSQSQTILSVPQVNTSQLKTLQVRLNPTPADQEILHQWFGAARWTYNQCLAYCRDRFEQLRNFRRETLSSSIISSSSNSESSTIIHNSNDEPQINQACKFTDYHSDNIRSITPNSATDGILNQHNMNRVTREELRSRFISSSAFSNDQSNAWVLRIPYSIRDNAMIDLLTAYKSNFTKMTRHQIVNFDLRFRCRTDLRQSIYIQHKDIHVDDQNRYLVRFYTSYLPFIQCSELLPDVNHDCRLLWLSRLNQYYLCIPVSLSQYSTNQSINPALLTRIISLDPGLRIFMTGYDPAGLIIEWAPYDIGRIYRLCHYLDNLRSRIDQRQDPHKRRYRMIKAWHRMIARIKHLIDEAQRHLVKWLCENYDRILIPKFDCSKMIRRGQRRLNSKVARGLVTWAHGKFLERLIAKSREYPNCEVKVVDEAYTSKTYGCCGYINPKLGGKREIVCQRCHIRMNRDHNGARNIMLKELSKSHP